MGCDIHIYIEKRLHKDLPWKLDQNHTTDKDGYLAASSASGRDYALFGLLASVRGGNAIYEPRGMPRDASPALLKYSKDIDWHSHSWLTLKEFEEVLIRAEYDINDPDLAHFTNAFYDWTQNVSVGDYPPSYITIVNYCRRELDLMNMENTLLDTNYKPEIRIVFWFDN